jgi:hypothetical protein
MGRPLSALELTAEEWEQGAGFAASCSLPHALVARAQDRNGLIAAATATHADGYAERGTALLMLEKKQQGRARRISVGAVMAYDTQDCAHDAGDDCDSTDHQERQEPFQQSVP